MNPHRLSDLLTDLCRRVNPEYSHGRQKKEFAEALEAVGIRPEHGNRGEERESMVLVDAGELASLRAEIDTLCAQVTAERVRGILREAIDCGMVPKSSAKEGGAMVHVIQAQVADKIRAALQADTTNQKEAQP